MAIVVNRSITSGDQEQQQMLNLFYPVGSYYETSNTAFDPNTAWGGNWVEDTAGRILVAQDNGTFDTIGATGGSETVTLTIEQMPTHNHKAQVSNTSGYTGADGLPSGAGFAPTVHESTITTSTGGGQPHNNLQPYVVIKRWHRIA